MLNCMRPLKNEWAVGWRNSLDQGKLSVAVCANADEAERLAHQLHAAGVLDVCVLFSEGIWCRLGLGGGWGLGGEVAILAVKLAEMKALAARASA